MSRSTSGIGSVATNRTVQRLLERLLQRVAQRQQLLLGRRPVEAADPDVDRMDLATPKQPSTSVLPVFFS